MVPPATPGGSPAAREWHVNVPLKRNNDLPYRPLGARRFCHEATLKEAEDTVGRANRVPTAQGKGLSTSRLTAEEPPNSFAPNRVIVLSATAWYDPERLSRGRPAKVCPRRSAPPNAGRRHGTKCGTTFIERSGP